jgi:hypothetical protein
MRWNRLQFLLSAISYETNSVISFKQNTSKQVGTAVSGGEKFESWHVQRHSSHYAWLSSFL